MTFHKGERFSLLDTGDTRLLGNYQIVDNSPIDTHMPWVFDSYEDALEKFNKLEGGLCKE